MLSYLESRPSIDGDIINANGYEWPNIIKYDVEEDVYLADCPVLPGCYTDGKTHAEAMANISDAIRLVIESRLAVGDLIL